jgi:hypothetical protein
VKRANRNSPSETNACRLPIVPEFVVTWRESIGTSQPPPPLLSVFNKEEIMPIIFVMWAVPALIFVGGVGYVLVRAIQ